MGRFLIFIIFLILLRKFVENLQKQQKQEQEEPREKEIDNYFQALGFPPPEEIKPEPKLRLRPEKPKEPVTIKKEIKKTETITPKLKPTQVMPSLEQTEKTKEELLVFSQEKLQEGIILSIILGPPKAYQIRRGGGIGIRAGLKNR